MSKPSGLTIIVWIIVFIMALALIDRSQAATYPPHKVYHVKLAPPVPCTFDNHMDVFFDEDNIMWACECEVLVSIYACRWQVIGGVEATSIRRRFKRLYHMPLPKGWLISRSLLV